MNGHLFKKIMGSARGACLYEEKVISEPFRDFHQKLKIAIFLLSLVLSTCE